MLSAAKNVFAEKGLEHVGNSDHSLAEREFSRYLTNAIAAEPDVLLLLNSGSQSSDTLGQAISFGLKERMTIIIVWASELEQFEALGADTCEGVYFGAQYWHTVEAPANKALDGLEYDGLTDRETVRAADHQVIKDYYLLKGKAKADMQDADDYAEIVSSGQSFLALEDTGCIMG